MTTDDWDEDRHREEIERIQSLLAALDAGPGSRRSKFRDLEIVCRRCGKIIAEVVALTPYRVLRFRGEGDHVYPEGGPTIDDIRASGATGLERGRMIHKAYAPTKRSIRRGEGRFVQLSWPRPKTAHITTCGIAVCDCASWTIQMGPIYDALEKRTRRVVWRPTPRDEPVV